MKKNLAQTQNLKKEVKIMKSIISLCISLALIFGMVQAFGVQAAPGDIINFPDANLKAALIENGVDANGDGEIT
ncbi:MAG: hypothetical protein LBS74_00725 [Oscillospiraceae bacterium]|nr:hypothetical protein [Oscillospiraceae bacterium]